MVFENKFIRQLEKRYFLWLLIIVAANAVVAAVLAASGTGWALWDKSQNDKRALVDQAQHVARVSIEAAKEDFYQIDFTAIDENLKTTVDLATANIAHLNMCIDAAIIHSDAKTPIAFKHCSLADPEPITSQPTALSKHTLALGDQDITTITLTVLLTDARSLWVNKALLVALLVIISQVPLFVAINYNFLYLKLLKPLILSLHSANDDQTKSLELIAQEQRIRESMMRLSSRLAKTKIQDAEKVYIAELNREDTFPNSIVVTKQRFYAPKPLEATAQQLADKLHKLSSHLTLGPTLESIDLSEPNSETAQQLHEALKPHISIDADLLVFRLTDKDQPIWFYLPRSTEHHENEFAENYVHQLRNQYADYQKFRQNMIDETLESYRELTKKDGTLPISEDTVYVEYNHPNALIYDTKRKERKVRLSLTKLQQLFPDHLVQTSKAYLVNPKHVSPEDVSYEAKTLRVKMGRSKIRIPLSQVYFNSFQSHIPTKNIA